MEEIKAYLNSFIGKTRPYAAAPEFKKFTVYDICVEHKFIEILFVSPQKMLLCPPYSTIRKKVILM